MEPENLARLVFEIVALISLGISIVLLAKERNRRIWWADKFMELHGIASQELQRLERELGLEETKHEDTGPAKKIYPKNPYKDVL